MQAAEAPLKIKLNDANGGGIPTLMNARSAAPDAVNKTLPVAKKALLAAFS